MVRDMDIKICGRKGCGVREEGIRRYKGMEIEEQNE